MLMRDTTPSVLFTAENIKIKTAESSRPLMKKSLVCSGEDARPQFSVEKGQCSLLQKTKIKILMQAVFLPASIRSIKGYWPGTKIPL